MSNEIQAGRDTDRRVAEALGYEVEEADGFLEMRSPCDLVGPQLYGWTKLSRFSTGIGAAWRLAEKLMKRHIVRISNGDGDSCDVDIITANVHITADTFPLAICRAFLKIAEEER